MIDDTALFNLRATMSTNGSDSLMLSDFLSRRDRDPATEVDSMIHYRRYQWGTDPRPSAVQAVMKKIISDSIPHIEAHLKAVLDANASIAFPRNLIDDAGSADTYEIDTTEILVMQSFLLGVKAVLVVLSTYDLDMTDTPKDIPDTITWDKFRADNPTILRKSDNWETAWSALLDADTKVTQAIAALRSEKDAQDSDFFQIAAGDSHEDRFVTDTDLTKTEIWLADTIADIIAGDSITSDTVKAYAEIGGMSVVPKTLFADPPDRSDFNNLMIEGYRGRGLVEWNDYWYWSSDPTLGGILPGMTLNKMYLFTHEPDTYFVVNADRDIDLNSLFQNWNHVPEKIDIKFDVAATVNVIRRPTSSDTRLWSISLTSDSYPQHALLLFDDVPDFRSWETFKIRRFGDFQGPRLRIVPWRSSDGVPNDAGSWSWYFSWYWSSVTVRNSWTNYAADTVQMFVEANGNYQFDSFATSTIKQVSPDTTLVVGAATQLGWFTAGAPAEGSDSTYIYGYPTWLTGETGTALWSDFTAYVYKLKVYPDTVFGYFSSDWEALPGVTVTFTISDYPHGATGYSLNTSETVTNQYGQASTRLTLGNIPGVYVVKANLSADSGGGEVLFFGSTTGIIQRYGFRDVFGPWYLFSLTRRPSSLSPSSIMASSSFAADEWKMYEYDPASAEYAQPDALAMGKGYWLKTLEDGYIDFTAATALTETQYVPLSAGWNIVGIPFDGVYATRNLLIQTAPSVAAVVALDTAADSGILYNRFYSWNGYSYSSCPDATAGRTYCYFYPNEGQWLRTVEACTLVIPPQSGSGSIHAPRLTSASYRPAANSEGALRSAYLLASPPVGDGRPDWTVQLIAQSGKYADMSNFIGLRPKSEAPVFEAPRAPNGVSLAVREGGERYASLYRPAGAEKPTWSLEVHSASAGVVTVRAGNIASVPADVPLTLTDIKTGAQTDLRRSSSYSYTSLPNETREFSVSTEAPSMWSKLGSKVTYPMACVITRTFGSSNAFTNRLRDLRDALLNTSFGRILASAYYHD